MLVLVVLTLIYVSCTNNSLQLASNGNSSYELVATTESAVESAEILQLYIKDITNAELTIKNKVAENTKQIVVSVDESITDDIIIETKADNVFIKGNTPDNLQNAVYVFLEEFVGCKWYSPTVTKLPEGNSVSIEKNINYKYSPELKTRTVHSRLFYNNLAFANAQRVTNQAFPKYAPAARVHTFHRFMPEEVFYIEHPEYYALRNNERLPTQLCLSNPKVLEIVTDSVAAIFKRFPEASVVSVSQDDNQQYCMCNSCSVIDKEEGSPAGSMIRFVNKVAAQFPDKTISTLAYQYTRKPCKTKPASNVLITLCSIECDRSAPIEEKCAAFADDLIGWGKLTNNIRIWDYTTQFTNFLSPFPNLHTLQPNIQFFKNNGAKWVFEQHSNNPSDLFELRSYITAKLLWNPEADFNNLLVEFTDGFYEEAGEYVREYIETLQNELKNYPDFFLFIYGDPSQAFETYLNPEMLTKYQEIFNNAEAAVQNKPQVLQRVKKARIGLDYAVLEACRKNISEKYSLTISKNNRVSVNTYVSSLLEGFKATCKKENITLMNEMGYTVTNYYEAYKKALQVIQQPNKAIGKKVTTLTKPHKYAKEDPMVLTDGALGGSSFYANWLGYEGNNMEVVIDLGVEEEISTINTAFLQVSNHIVFFPETVTYSFSNNNKKFTALGTLSNKHPLSKKSKINDIQYFNLKFDSIKARYIKVTAKNVSKAPYWHHAAGLPVWIFADEVIIN